MDRYTNLANFGSLIGSEPNGKIKRKASLLNGQTFEWEYGSKDVENIRYAIDTLLQLGFHAGSTRAVLPTKPGLEISLTKENLKSFMAAVNQYPLRMADIYTGTAHPQGGNTMAAASSGRPGVVDENFRVMGYDNLYVTDASIFPTSLTVNPQWTIMAMSSMASKEILNAHP